MGICACFYGTRKQDDQRRPRPPSAKVVNLEGRLQEFRQRVTAEEVLSLHPNSYLCSSDSMVINSKAPQLPKDYALQHGQIYFIMPLSKSLTPLSLQDFCDLAIKTNRALNNTCGPIIHECRKLAFSGGRNIITF